MSTKYLVLIFIAALLTGLLLLLIQTPDKLEWRKEEGFKLQYKKGNEIYYVELLL